MAENRNQQTLSWMFRLMVGSFVFQALGYVTPGWIYVKFSPSRYVMTGMWYTVLCIGKCKTVGVSDYKSIGFHRDGNVISTLVQYQVETTLALLACIVAMVAFKRYKNSVSQDDISSHPKATMFYLGMFACFVSGILALIAVSSLGNKSVATSNLYRKLLGKSPVQFPYSLFITGLGVVLAVIAFIIALARKPWQPEAVSANTQGFVMSQPYQPATTGVNSSSYPPAYSVPNNYPTSYVVSSNDYPTKTDKMNNAS